MSDRTTHEHEQDTCAADGAASGRSTASDGRGEPSQPAEPAASANAAEWALTAGERRRLARLNRQARRERRGRKPHTAPNGDELRSRRPLARRLRRATLIGACTLVLTGLLVPPFLIPVDGVTSSRFFLQTAPDSPLFFDFEHHTGVDIAAPTGTPVRVSRSGRVIAVGDDPRYGRFVDIRHLFGWVTRYAHLSAVHTREGRLVLRNTRIGEVGATGRATGPHLHFEIRAGGRAMPPGLFLLFHSVRRRVFADGR